MNPGAGCGLTVKPTLERNRIERTLNRLKPNRRIATRYEKRAHNYLAMLTIASILLWL